MPPVVLREPLTEREQAVLALLAEGANRKQMARRFHCRPKTIENHIYRIYRKLGISEVDGSPLVLAVRWHLARSPQDTVILDALADLRRALAQALAVLAAASTDGKE